MTDMTLAPALVSGILSAYRVPPEAIGLKVYVNDYPMATVRITPAGRVVTASHWWVNVLRQAKRRERRLGRDTAREAWKPALIHKGGKP